MVWILLQEPSSNCSHLLHLRTSGVGRFSQGEELCPCGFDMRNSESVTDLLPSFCQIKVVKSKYTAIALQGTVSGWSCMQDQYPGIFTHTRDLFPVTTFQVVVPLMLSPLAFHFWCHGLTSHSRRSNKLWETQSASLVQVILRVVVHIANGQAETFRIWGN
jgi:hypothetical protein